MWSIEGLNLLKASTKKQKFVFTGDFVVNYIHHLQARNNKKVFGPFFEIQRKIEIALVCVCSLLLYALFYISNSEHKEPNKNEKMK
jgi:hypothetical protein